MIDIVFTAADHPDKIKSFIIRARQRGYFCATTDSPAVLRHFSTGAYKYSIQIDQKKIESDLCFYINSGS